MGRRSTGRSRWPSSSRARRARSTAGARCATRSTQRCASRASTPSATPSRSTTASPHLDASLLMIPLVGFLPARRSACARHRPRRSSRSCCATASCSAIRDPSLERVDGLPPGEGVFLPCTFWLADNYALQGREREAHDVFERLLALRNDLGLLSEEYDPSTVSACSEISRRRSRTCRWSTPPGTSRTRTALRPIVRSMRKDSHQISALRSQLSAPAHS